MKKSKEEKKKTKRKENNKRGKMWVKDCIFLYFWIKKEIYSQNFRHYNNPVFTTTKAWKQHNLCHEFQQQAREVIEIITQETKYRRHNYREKQSSGTWARRSTFINTISQHTIADKTNWQMSKQTPTSRVTKQMGGVGNVSLFCPDSLISVNIWYQAIWKEAPEIACPCYVSLSLWSAKFADLTTHRLQYAAFWSR